MSVEHLDLRDICAWWEWVLIDTESTMQNIRRMTVFGWRQGLDTVGLGNRGPAGPSSERCFDLHCPAPKSALQSRVERWARTIDLDQTVRDWSPLEKEPVRWRWDLAQPVNP